VNTKTHECQCQEHDCRTVVACPDPEQCQRIPRLHLCHICFYTGGPQYAHDMTPDCVVLR
jgi:hypothetical protein